MKTKHEKFIEKFKTYPKNEEYSVIGEYKSTREKLLFKHNICNHTFEMTPNNFQRGQRCPNCNKYKQKTTSEIYDEVKKISNGEYELIGEYKNSHSKIKLLHHKCNKIHKITIGDFRRGFGCSYCSNNRKINYNDYKDIINKLDNNYSFIYNINTKNKYKNVHSKIDILHKECGYEFKMNYNNFRNGQRCPLCSNLKNESKHVKFIKTILIIF